MPKSRFALCLLACNAALFFVQAAAAQTFHRKFELFAEGGVSLSNQFTAVQQINVNFHTLQTSEFSARSSLRTTGRLFSGVRLWLDRDQAIEANYSFSPSYLESSFSCQPSSSCDGVAPRSFKMWANIFAVNYVHTLPQINSFRPFLTAGGGVLSLVQEYPNYVKHDPFTVNLGGGFDRDITQHWALRTEFRDWLFDMPHLGESGSGLVHNIVPSLGPVFRF